MRGRALRLLPVTSLLLTALIVTVPSAIARSDTHAAPTAVFVAGGPTLKGGDLDIAARVELAGFDLEIVDDDDVDGADVGHAGLLLISTSVVPAKVGDALVETPVPTLIWEAYLFDDMEISSARETPGTHRAVTVSDPTHPLAAGFPAGRVDVYSSPNKLNSARVCNDAQVAAHVPGATGQAAIFGYPTAAELCDGSTSRGPRAGVFPDWKGSGGLSREGVALIDASIAWLTSTPSCLTQSNIPVSQCVALIDLFETTNGPDEDDGWNDTSNWLDFDAGPCRWFGVVCQSGGVRGLELADNDLTGTLPTSIGDLTDLTELQLQFNDIGGPLPAEVAIGGLQTLWLEGNKLVGPIPPELGSLDQLEFLLMNFNSFSGPIPAELGQLSRLRLMWLSGNDLSGAIPSTFGGLTELRSLELGQNALTGPIPAELGDLTMLERLDLDNNQLSGPLPDSLWTLPALSRLHVHRNQLSGPISEAIQDPPLNRLLLRHNGCFTAGEATAAYIASIDPFWDDGCATAVLITGSTSPPKSDDIFVERFEAAGLDVVIVDDDDMAALDLTDVEVIGISTSVVPNKVRGIFRDVPVPLIVWEPHLFPDLAMSASGETSTKHTSIRIVDPDHPVASGLDGSTAVYHQPNKLNYGSACEGADIIAHVPGSSQRATVFAYDVVDSLCDGKLAPARRVALFPTFQGAQQLTADGISIIDGAIAWSRAPVVGESCREQTDMPPLECRALLEFFDSTDSDVWFNTTNWLDFDAGPCSWHGVGCDNGHVDQLVIHFNRLGGSLPDALGLLTEMTILSLDANDIGGSIPRPLGELTSLRELRLNGNELVGSIPAQLGELADLEILFLASNHLMGSIPKELADLRTLELLLLSYNELSGEIPSELGALDQLVGLGLDDNQLNGSIPPELGNLSSLEHFLAEGNQLSGPIPPELGRLSNLVNLNLRRNRLSAIPAELRNLTNLAALLLQGNELGGSIPGELAELTSLENLDLGNNRLEGTIPTELGGLTSLRFLNLIDNRLDGEIPEALGGLRNLERLNLGFNQLTGSIPESLSTIDQLNQLSLSHNRLSNEAHQPFIFPTSFEKLDNLRVLALDHNEFEGLVPDEILEMDTLQPNPGGIPPIVQLSGNRCLTASPMVADYLDLVARGWDDGCIMPN